MAPRLPILLAALLLAPSPPAAAGEEEALAVRVNRALARSAANLIARQAEDGSFQKEDPVHPLGRTALCTFALLHAGLAPEHPAVAKALAFLGVSGDYGGWKRPRSTYEASCLVLLLNALGKAHGRQIREICDWLVANFNDGQGLWGYPEGQPDLSNTQYAALALKAGERHGWRAPEKLWRRLAASVLKLQAGGGAFRYRAGTMYRATMTHAALLILSFAEEALGAKAPRREIREASDAARKWLAENWSIERNPYGRGWSAGNWYYYMYGLERYAVLSGLEKIAGHDWYREGAEELIARQAEDGSWGSLEETAFAILFLRRATLTEPEAKLDLKAAGEEKPPGPPKRPAPHESVPCLREWLVAGPFAGSAQEDDFLFTQDVDPRRLAPAAGGRAGNRRWEELRSPNDRIDFKLVLEERPWASYCATTWLEAAEETEAVLWFGSDDGLRVWLDGAEILFGHHHDSCGDDYYRVPVRLSAGRHVLLLQVENLEYYVWFRARLSDAAGRPHPSVTAGLRR